MRTSKPIVVIVAFDDAHLSRFSADDIVTTFDCLFHPTDELHGIPLLIESNSLAMVNAVFDNGVVGLVPDFVNFPELIYPLRPFNAIGVATPIL